MNILVAILVFSLLILFHELGHFSLAKLNGIRVNEFSLGLGPTIFGFTKGETKYSLKAFPFGGSCAMLGEDGEEKPLSHGSFAVFRESRCRSGYHKAGDTFVVDQSFRRTTRQPELPLQELQVLLRELELPLRRLRQ